MLAHKLQEAAGNATQPTYIEDVFSTYLYTGNGSTQTITNGIDLAGKGGLVWVKKRNSATDGNHILFDTARGQPWLSTNNTNAQLGSSGLINYNSDGFGWTFGSASWNQSSDTFASWTFRKQPKFFDVQTFTDSPHQAQTINHSLGATPGMVILKSTSGADNWYVYHTSLGTSSYLTLNATGGTSSFANWITVSSTQITIAASFLSSGASYVMYIFASNAGGFGLTGTDNVITCGTYTGAGGNTSVNLGFEPQFVITKGASVSSNWTMFDNMRGVATGGVDAYLKANLADAETNSTDYIDFNSTGFTLTANSNLTNGSGYTYIYIAIRRGPMRVPTSGTSVLHVDSLSGSGSSNELVNAGFPPDMFLTKNSSGNGFNWILNSRLMGDRYIVPNNTWSATSSTDVSFTKSSIGVTLSTWAYVNSSSYAYNRLSFKRAKGFMDIVIYNGTGSTHAETHGLGVIPELMIIKTAGTVGNGNGAVYHKAMGAGNYMYLESSDPQATISSMWNNTNPTSSNFTVGSSAIVNGSGYSQICFMFATLAGVSKVGSYTGDGSSSRVIDCGFTSGARLVLIKRADSTGNWYLWNSALGIVTGNDPYLLLNTTNSADSSTDYIDPNSSGFQISTSVSEINGSGGTYIYLAIA